MSDIFISYASEDRERIRPLAHALEAHGWSVFWDPNIPTGKSWREVLDTALTDARCVVVAWSNQSIVSRWVHEEAEEARERSILIPVFIEKVRPPLGFRGVQAADLSEWDDTKHSDVFERLVTDIDAHLGPFHGETSKADQTSRVAVEDGGAKEADPANTDRPAEPLALPDKPSIAVLPFVNMSGDPEQEFFSDGMTEDIITTLTRILGLFVIARTSSFMYKDKAIDVKQVSRDLGVRYVLEGSVRTARDRVRVTAQLIDAHTGLHLWANRYDRELTDVFAVQDEITTTVVKALQVELVEGEQARDWHHSTHNVEAWSCLSRAVRHADNLSQEENQMARKLVEEALQLDPTYAAAWVWLGLIYCDDVRFLWASVPDESLAKATECAERARALDDNYSELYALLGDIYLIKDEFDVAVESCEHAVALNPSGAYVTAFLGNALNYAGRPEEALNLIRKAMRFSPHHPSWYFGVEAHANRLLGYYEKAVVLYQQAINQTPDLITLHIGLTASYAEMGRLNDARTQAAEVLRIDPKFSIGRYAKALKHKQSEHAQRSLEALSAAGLVQ